MSISSPFPPERTSPPNKVKRAKLSTSQATISLENALGKVTAAVGNNSPISENFNQNQDPYTPPSVSRSLFGPRDTSNLFNFLDVPLPNFTDASLINPPTPIKKTTPTISRSLFTPPESRSNFLNRAVPPTPKKPTKNSSSSSYEILFRQADRKKFILFNEQTINLTYMDNGSYMNVYTIKSEKPIYHSISNDELLVKMYHGAQGFKEAQLNSYLKNSQANYKYALEAGLPVAKIYNIETSDKDLCFVQEKIPQEVDVNHSEAMDQVKIFFTTVLAKKATVEGKKEKKKFDLDLCPGNLRMKADGTVVLVDFIEDHKDGFFIEQSIRQWTRRFRQSFESGYQGDPKQKFEASKEAARNFLASFTKEFKPYKDYTMSDEEVIADEFFEIKK